MGIGDYVNWATDAVNQKLPPLSSVRHGCYTSYEYCSFAVSAAGRAVRLIPLPKLPESVQDPEIQAKIKGFASIVGKNAAESALHESLKLLPGGYVISKSFSEFYKSGNGKDKKIKELEAEIQRLKMENTITEISVTKQAVLVNDREMKKEHQNAPVVDLQVYQAPEDVLRVFMMKHFIGSHLLDDLIVPGTGGRDAKK